MPYDADLAERVRELLADQETLREQKMFGGLSFMVRGNLACGVLGEDLVIRVPPEEEASALEEAHVREMDFTGRRMRGWLYVGPRSDLDDDEVERWVARSLDHCLSLKPK